ncbi:MAG: hypothetical protein HY559_02570 [Gammaproteobacteria bacterium]|nr:hypothetical protein [Gammaproteobacteria bacterium]
MIPEPSLQRLTIQQYERLIKNSEILSGGIERPKVFRDRSGDVWKIFRRRRRLTSDLWRPYAFRFIRNAEVLQKRGISTVKIKGLYETPHTEHWKIVHYGYLEGIPFEDLPFFEQRGFEALARWVAQLHQKGIYFRSLHLKNILWQLKAEQFALVDVSDMACFPKSLGVWRRARNFKALFRRPQDAHKLQKFGTLKFIEAYCDEAKLSGIREKVFLYLLALYNRGILKKGELK